MRSRSRAFGFSAISRRTWARRMGEPPHTSRTVLATPLGLPQLPEARERTSIDGDLPHPELAEQGALGRVVLIVPDALGDEVDGAGVVEGHIGRLTRKRALDLLPEQGRRR